MKLTETTEILDREVAVPDRAHRGVKFSSTRFGSSTVEIDFTRWVDMGYPNQVAVTVTPVPRAVPQVSSQTLAATG